MKHLLYRFSFAFLLLALGSCQDFVKDLDVDPNSPADVDAATMLQGAELADALVHGSEAARIASMWTSQFTGAAAQYTSINTYDVGASNFDNIWSTMYVDVAAQSRIGAAKAITEGNGRLAGIFQILEAHSLGTAAALFGDVPFRQVNDRSNLPNPVYDPQRQVYDDLQRQLSEAINNLGGVGGTTRDVYFQGDAQRWIEVAHSLKARYYLHTKQYEQARQEALQGISANEFSWQFPHGEVRGTTNFYFQFNTARGGYLSGNGSYAARLLDPSRRTTIPNSRNNAQTDERGRFAYYFTPARAATPEQYGLRTNSGYAEPAEDFPLLTYSENQLILAETNARAGNLNDALTALNNHRAALAIKFPTGRYDAYTLATVPGGGTQSNLIREILTERYVSFIGQIEAFNDLRRTGNLIGLPNKRQVPGQPTPPYPERFLYSQAEINTNTSLAQPIPDLYQKTPVNQ